ncbi:MAG: chemotaxis response regulator protein-glutamate methylesterase [Gemmatimonadaceae bacterium]|nr:chemotaxis response regulator protein-glutamate methylesterase [Gemmatimonadaceae bacterium]
MFTSEHPIAAIRARVLVVDDSAFMRRLVSDVIGESGEFDVVGTARDGVHAVLQVHALNPDIVTLDVDMPGRDGLAALQQIMREAPRPVVMLSAGGVDGGAEATLRALELGAVEFVRKPSGAISLDLDDVREQLLEALRAAACANRETLFATSGRGATPTGTMAGHASTPTRQPRVRDERDRRATHVVCVAASTGGPAALAQVIPHLPRFSSAAVLIVQHMPPGFTHSLAQRLDVGARLRVHEAEHETPILAGHAYLAPGGFHLRVGTVDGVQCLLLDTAPTLWGVRPAADHLFTTAAWAFRDACVGVVLTGMGCDGAAGLFAIRHAGGRGIVQDSASSVIAGMPMAALQHAGADHILPLNRIADTIASLLEAPAGAELCP